MIEEINLKLKTKNEEKKMYHLVVFLELVTICQMRNLLR